MFSRARHLTLAVALLAGAAGAQAAPAAAAPPPNDARAAAQPVGALPATLRGLTAEATLEADENPTLCGPAVKGSVWYSLHTAEARAIIVALDAGGDMDAAVEVLQRQRSQLLPVGCRLTDRRGAATIDLDAERDADYLIRVAPLANSVTEPFTLRVIAPDPPARPPGQALPASGVAAQVDRLANPDDAWSLVLERGRTYRINFVSPGGRCPAAALYRPGVAGFGRAPLKGLRCDEQTLFTPAADGRYTVHVAAPRASRAQIPYRLRAGLAGDDDTAPGIELANDDRVAGALQGGELDALDLYRFSIARRSDLRVRLETTREFQVLLLSAGGRRLAADGEQIDARIRPGRYFIAVRARDGAGGGYTLSRLARTITRARTLAAGERSARVDAGRAIALSVRVSPAVDGRATMVVERFDPLAGWLFDARLSARVRGGVATVDFRPSSVGRWRVTGEFEGTRRASPSRGGTAEFTVTEPVTDG